MESSQIICGCSHVAEKIQEALPHRKKVNKSNQTKSSTYRSVKRENSHLTSFIQSIYPYSSAFHNMSLTHPHCLLVCMAWPTHTRQTNYFYYSSSNNTLYILSLYYFMFSVCLCSVYLSPVLSILV